MAKPMAVAARNGNTSANDILLRVLCLFMVELPNPGLLNHR
jgi:hypothetical protein